MRWLMLNKNLSQIIDKYVTVSSTLIHDKYKEYLVDTGFVEYKFMTE
jgi:hypothetical protein